MIAVKRLVYERLVIAFHNYFQEITGYSVSTRTKRSGATYVIPPFNVEHAGRLHVFGSWTTTELVAIRRALEHLRTFDYPSPMVLQGDSRSTFLQLYKLDQTGLPAREV